MGKGWRFGWVVLPDHLHAPWTLLKVDADDGSWWRLIKVPFARALPDPVKHLLIGKPEPYPSLHREIGLGRYGW